MVEFPNCKINIGLYVTGKRPDGFHNIQTLFYPVPIRDILEIIESDDGQFHFKSSGLSIGNNADNLCVKAYHLLREHFSVPPVKMHLHKTIPSGAGLGGGSSDASFTLCLLNKKFNLGIRESQLELFAGMLGSDCPFFIVNKPCIGTGRGEILEPVELDLSTKHILIINPGIHVNTSWAFSQLKHTSPPINLQEICQMPVAIWKDNIRNDFEEASCRQFPEISHIIDWMYHNNALYASMTGTGSSVYGIFDVKPAEHPFPPHYFFRWV